MVAILLSVVALAVAPAHSAQATRVLQTPTLCVRSWKPFLREHGVKGDAPSLTFLMFSGEDEVTELAFPEAACNSVLRPWNYPDWVVAIDLYSVATAVDVTGTERGVVRTFYKLRRAFNIRKQVTVSDFY